jgi:hypothetical protein
MRCRLALSALFLLAGCVSSKYTPPEPPAPRNATSVNASQGRTWDAVIDVFADRNIPIRNMERVSGLIVTEELRIFDTASTFADCGRVPLGYGERPKRKKGEPQQKGRQLSPTRAAYNVLVRGDSSASTVKATVRWTGPGTVQTGMVECATKGVWEPVVEAEIKRRAESENTAVAPSQGTSADHIRDLPPGTKWIANRQTKTYYQVGCSAAARIAPGDRIFFQTESAALVAGFTAGREC